MPEPLLDIKNITASYGDLQVLWDISLNAQEKEIIAVLGANGAGKSTLLRCIAGLHRLEGGAVHFKGRDLQSIPPYRRINEGIMLVPEERGVFPELSVEENLKIGGFIISDKALLKEAFEWVFDLFPILKRRRRQLAGSLSGGEQQMLSIARGLISRPRLLMLDELSLGLAPVVVLKLLDMIRRIHEMGITLIVVDQNVDKLLSISDRGYILENGRVVLEGEAEKIRKDPRTKKAFLGR